MLYEKFEYNINNLIGNFGLSKIAIAVSGGSDSISLLYLANIWARKNNIELFVISVDHNLRPQSKQENYYIHTISSNLNRKYYNLSFDHQNNFSNLQERAREGRYDLMTNLCLELDVLVLLTAHHEDDYVENFCLRLERNSGIFGLSSSNIHWYNNIQIIRPLYNIPKSELVEYLVNHKIKWFEDESNLSDKYRRNIIRQKLFKEENYIKAEISLQQLKTNKLIEDELKPALISAIAEAVKIFEYGFTFLDLVKFDKFLNEVKAQIINFLLIMISGQSRSARFYSIAHILKLISQDINFKNTVHGCVIKRIQNELLIYREFGKKLPKSKILLDKSVIWDNRFCITKNQKTPDCVITYLSLADYKAIKKQLDLKHLKNLSCKNHNAILFTLPIIKILEKVIAIPHISYYDNDVWNFEVSFAPNFVSRFTHFC
ncbi:tRNA lysidine(34) synthetase TilS [Rickettsia prowazekii]|uniref:tRNA(Ile)-lysidine synthase n=2 Tax=Rickettsia prowazekii TaxID=782 RepID=TILS_RICPR|nr:tRNA lysidine(34) synthetase TilS [Rickettsia prowazekii]Q9ZEA3.1 RecName: Full=tRNA(Ile)-lysidine synthase; AltName: Full=tRNA(Ile)-2-lysyl-cytidine synthase; AltName: Full=tRNA(Ile)-lysidine synthetase [Rickettsia prowazekii str. Madrid E]EOB10137.1 tRNA(Ile)-lysidine synthase [Rickettsia prowazekii str. GvF12]ADE29553.1 tRNA(Ile)-lysidine synthetase [Rickettsia prowazekii str. Rp22]AFE48872.1 cell cycle protein MESJ (mesJ) [Rickettsia prowazekii str. Chernikova]AFE49717.1 cell cycle prot